MTWASSPALAGELTRSILAPPDADPSIPCWDPYESLQPLMAVCSLLGLSFYLLTVHLLAGDGGLLRQAQEVRMEMADY